jgi:NAD-dependent DNA ligase
VNKTPFKTFKFVISSSLQKTTADKLKGKIEAFGGKVMKQVTANITALIASKGKDKN